MRRDRVSFGNSQDKSNSVVLICFLVCLRDTEGSQTGRQEGIAVVSEPLWTEDDG